MRVAVVGFGNVGKYAVEAVLKADDMEFAGIVRRKDSIHEASPRGLVVSDITELGDVDVAVICTPSRTVPTIAKELLALGINTVDCYDIHGELLNLRDELDEMAKSSNAVSVLSAGWDPGTDSLIRALLQAMAPSGVTYTNFGPGMSMGHTAAVKAIDGVADALSMTIPVGTGLHRRIVYVVLEDNAEFTVVEKAIKEDAYFIHDETHVYQVEDVSTLVDMGHGVSIERKGVSGITHNQLFKWDMRINNPALTAQIMVAAARATVRLQPGAYTLIEIPVIDLLPGDRRTWIGRLV